MSKSIEVKVGVEIEPEELKTLDPAKMGVSLAGTPQESDVEGQYRHWRFTQCPCCGNIGRSLLDSEVYLWFTCGFCGCPFKA